MIDAREMRSDLLNMALAAKTRERIWAGLCLWLKLWPLYMAPS